MLTNTLYTIQYGCTALMLAAMYGYTLTVKALRLVKAVQDFSGGCSTSIRPQIDVPFIK